MSLFEMAPSRTKRACDLSISITVDAGMGLMTPSVTSKAISWPSRFSPQNRVMGDAQPGPHLLMQEDQSLSITSAEKDGAEIAH